MGSHTEQENLKSGARPKIHIGSRVPDENRGWLKYHGIVTDEVSVFKKPSLKNSSPLFLYILFFLAGVSGCLLVAVGVQLYHERAVTAPQENERIASLEASNHHLRLNVERQFSIGSFQQLEIERLSHLLEDTRADLGYKIWRLERQVAVEGAIGTMRDAAESHVTEIVVTAENSLSYLP